MNQDNKLKLYGCYLDAGQHWQCAKFDSVKEADKFAFQTDTKHTRLIPIPRYVPVLAEKIYLKRSLTCSVTINKVD
jgi:hypothetical protein